MVIFLLQIIAVQKRFRAGRPFDALQDILKMQTICLGLDCRCIIIRLERVRQDQDAVTVAKLGRLRHQALQALAG